MLKLTWKPSPAASRLHALRATIEGRAAADPTLADALAEPAAEVVRVLSNAQAEPHRAWQYLVGMAERVGDPVKVAQFALLRSSSPLAAQTYARPLADALSAADGVACRRQPHLPDELPLRVRPLREQWEARGPGLLRRVAEATDRSVLPPHADVLLVQPVVGGDGWPQPWGNSVVLEGVLANPLPELPEVVRLAWLLAQLNAELPFSDAIPFARRGAVMAAAMLPAVLSAAAEVELVAWDEATLRRAIDAWRIECAPPLDAAVVIARWWNAYEAARPTWADALTVLYEEMFPSVADDSPPTTPRETP